MYPILDTDTFLIPVRDTCKGRRREGNNWSIDAEEVKYMTDLKKILAEVKHFLDIGS